MPPATDSNVTVDVVGNGFVNLIVTPDARLERSVVAMSSWYAELDRELMTAVEGLSEDDIANRKIIRSDFDVTYFAPLPKDQLDVYREALLIFYGKASVYLRAMGRALPGQWQEWIG